ncbi:MAG TPA: SGNH/GDSL hydrolase family protein, partial [bacterium]|nr:SGNH/GDSL hydrolase family protein [bacterium]
IACLGDSTTFGVFSQDERETYPRQLESFLRMSGGCETCEVLNLGTNGYGTLHGAILMKETVPALKADAVIAYFGWNDRTRIVGWQDHREKIQFVQSPWNRSALVRWLIRTSDPWIQNLRFSRKLRFFAGPSWVKHGAALAEVEENLKTFIKRSREKGIAPVLVTTPWGWPEEFLTKYTLAMPAEKQAMTPSVYSMVYNIHQYNDLVRKTAEETGALFVDLEAVFRKIPSKERPSFFYSDFMHPNSQGAHLIAESLAPAVHDVIKNST